MIGSGKVVGIILIVLGLILLVVGGVWLFSEDITAGGRVLGLLLGLLVLAPIIGVGVYLLRQGTVEQTQFATVQQEKKLLNMILTQGQVTVPEMVAELNEPKDTVEDMIRSVVGKQLFSGAIDWKRGILYSVESQKLVGEQKCPNCGGDLRFAGKGLIVCPYCGSEVFLTKRAAASTNTEPVTAPEA
jgi:DNA-directed RNA polymerase subunit RPC12/RpoP